MALESILPQRGLWLRRLYAAARRVQRHIYMETGMKHLAIYIMAITMSVIFGCQVGCGENDAEEALIIQNLSDHEREEQALTQQSLYENADWKLRWKESEAAHKRYIRLRRTYPNAALNAYIEYRNWMQYGHPLATEIAKVVVKADMAGEWNIPDKLQVFKWELQIAKDNKDTKDYIAELEGRILFWSEFAKELEAEGEDPAKFIIAFEISDEWLNTESPTCTEQIELQCEINLTTLRKRSIIKHKYGA